MPLLSCARCGAHVFGDADTCPSCGAAPSPTRLTAAAALMGLTLGGCVLQGEPEYGVVVSYDDEDGDGYYAQTDDCDDTDAAINPGAIDTVDDGVDSNCDGDDNT